MGIWFPFTQTHPGLNLCSTTSCTRVIRIKIEWIFSSVQNNIDNKLINGNRNEFLARF